MGRSVKEPTKKADRQPTPIVPACSKYGIKKSLGGFISVKALFIDGETTGNADGEEKALAWGIERSESITTTLQ